MGKMKRPSLTISPDAPRPSLASLASSAELSPSSSPRHGLLASRSSPPGSPTLSDLDDYLDEKPQKYYRRPCVPRNLAISILLILSGTLLLLHSIIHDFRVARSPASSAQTDSEVAAIIVANNQGQKKWTVSISPEAKFPLRPWQYEEICAQSHKIQQKLLGSQHDKLGYYDEDKSYVDVADAIKSNLIPGAASLNSSSAVSRLPFLNQTVCKQSMTFVMETEDAGMGNSLLALWLSYGLAKKEGRAFFLDDTRWTYGKYSTYFQLIPRADCIPPPVYERVPCPRSARHLVVSAATFKYTYGSKFEAEFVDKNKPEQYQHHKINHLMELGYKELFRIADSADAVHVQNQTRGVLYDNVKKDGGMTIGVHVRHGDLHPWEPEFKDEYLPIKRYMNAVREILIKAFEHDDERSDSNDNSTATSNATDNKHKRRHAAPGFAASRVLLASDDPLVYNAPEMSRLVRAQDRIVLVTSDDLKKMHEGKDDNDDDDSQGWEGGFFASKFLEMGKSQARKSFALHRRVARDDQKSLHHPTPEPTAAMLAEREIVGRAYVLDLAVLGQSDHVVCAVSSAACRILGVMLGWERIEKQNQWRNVDGKAGWQGLIVPP